MKTMCMSCHKAIVVITGRAHCFHDNMSLICYSEFPAFAFIMHTFTYFVYLKIKKRKLHIQHRVQLLSIHRIIPFHVT